MAEQVERERLPDEQAETSAITLGECIDMYAAMEEESKRLDQLVSTLRRQILEVMAEHNLEMIRHGHYEAVRQVKLVRPGESVEELVLRPAPSEAD